VIWPSRNLYRHLTSSARSAALPYHATGRDHAALFERIRPGRVYMLGEASHGTQDFYHLRASITKYLIEHHGVNAVAVEADWPDAYRVNRFVRGEGSDQDANSALAGFERFPSWMWRNTEVLSFVRWLRDWNDEHPNNKHPNNKVGFYGLDLYSLNTSIQAVVSYLDRVDPEAATLARNRYACFDHFAGDTQAYGYAASAGIIEPCEDDVVQQLEALRNRAAEYVARDGDVAEDEYFFAEQNARLATNAEEYYRAMFRGRHSSWNIRDTHMADTFGTLMAFLSRRNGVKSSIAVWAHNSHLGDARATEMADRGELNLGQLLRQRYSGESRSIGFTTYDGTVTAASGWDSDAERKFVRPALAGSIESVMHDVGIPQFVLHLHDERLAGFASPLLERAIGVIYRPQSERQSHYFNARVTEQFDALIHVDRSTALVPLEPSPHWYHEEVPETYPSGL
jgi:erythromycin esterase-like protein